MDLDEPAQAIERVGTLNGTFYLDDIINWDGRGERGKELASGVYLYRLRAGEQLETRKLVLVR
jgi:hypothetical protein